MTVMGARRPFDRGTVCPPSATDALVRRRLTWAADAVRATMLCVAAAFLVAGDGSAALRALLALPPSLAARVFRVHPGFDLIFALALAAEGLGTGFGAYDSISWRDTLAHIALPLLSAPVLYAGLVRLGAATEPTAAPSARLLLGAALVTAAAVLSLGAMWELVEWAADHTLRTDYSQGYRDTFRDLRNDAIAAAAGGALVVVWLGASARKPASNLAMIQLDPANRASRRPRPDRA